MEDRRKSAPKVKGVGRCQDEETETSQNVPMWTIDLGSFEVLSDHGDEVDDDVSSCETTEMMPPLPPHALFKKTETLCGMFQKPCSETTETTKSIHSLTVGMGSKSSSTRCNKWILGHQTHWSLYPM